MNSSCCVVEFIDPLLGMGRLEKGVSRCLARAGKAKSRYRREGRKIVSPHRIILVNFPVEPDFFPLPFSLAFLLSTRRLPAFCSSAAVCSFLRNNVIQGKQKTHKKEILTWKMGRKALENVCHYSDSRRLLTQLFFFRLWLFATFSLPTSDGVARRMTPATSQREWKKFVIFTLTLAVLCVKQKRGEF